MRPIDADAVLAYVYEDAAKMKAKIECNAPYYVGTQTIDIVNEVEELIRIYLEGSPTLDYAPVVHGEWKFFTTTTHVVPVTDWMQCTACRGRLHRLSGVRYNFCPNCGAKMDGKENF